MSRVSRQWRQEIPGRGSGKREVGEMRSRGAVETGDSAPSVSHVFGSLSPIQPPVLQDVADDLGAGVPAQLFERAGLTCLDGLEARSDRAWRQ